MIRFFECVWQKVYRDMERFLSVIGGLLLLFLTITLIGCLFLGCLPAWFEGALTAVGAFLVIALVLLLASILLNGAACAIGAGLDIFSEWVDNTFDVENANGVSTVTGALQPLTCEEAQAALARAQQARAATALARAAQRERTDRARDRLRAAEMGLVVALAALLAVPFWRPDFLLGAIGAVAAAGALVLRRTQRLAAEVSALVLAEAAAAEAAAAFSAASALVAVLCGSRPGTPTTIPPTLGDFVNPVTGIAVASPSILKDR